jgi:hypothetical protein
MLLDDALLQLIAEAEAERGAFVHVDEVVPASLLAINWGGSGHHRVTLSGSGDFDTTAAHDLLEWSPRHIWPTTNSDPGLPLHRARGLCIRIAVQKCPAMSTDRKVPAEGRTDRGPPNSAADRRKTTTVRRICERVSASRA